MAEFYHDLVTQKSFELLKDLRRKFNFVLIGGWAVYLYTQALKSKDIDIIVDFSELAKLKDAFLITKNERLKKYEFKVEQVDIDLYLPHYSKLGFPVEEIAPYTRSIEGFIAPRPEILLILKGYVARQREGTSKGKKDIIDIFSLLKAGVVDWPLYVKIVKKFGLSAIVSQLKEIILTQNEIPEIGLSRHAIARLKKKTLQMS